MTKFTLDTFDWICLHYINTVQHFSSHKKIKKILKFHTNFGKQELSRATLSLKKKWQDSEFQKGGSFY